MKQTMNTIVKLVVFLGMGSIQAFGKPFAKGPYLGQTPPGPIAKVFAPGLICNTGKRPWEAFGTFSADGNTFCFQRISGVFITENTDQGWTAPELIRSIPANMYAPWSACLSPDANSIYFTRALVKPLFKRKLYRCNRTAGGWGKPQQLGPPLSSSYKDINCSIAANNNIYLSSTRKGGDGRKPTHGIWVVPFVGNTWTQAVNINLNLTPLRACCPGIAPDESFMVFYSIRPGAIPGTETDLYLILRRPDGTWTKPRNMGPKINTGYHEHGPRISPDKKYLFFNRSNGWDPRIYSVYSYIYWVELKEYLPESYRSPEGMVNGHRDPMKSRSVMKQITEVGSIQALAEPIAKGPYLGQTPPGSTAQVFAPGLICDTRPHQWESHGHFSADGNTFCFARRRLVFITENTDQGWTTPVRIKSIPYRVWSPCLSPDANSIYFSRRYDPPKGWTLHRCIRTSQGWSSPKELGPPFNPLGAAFSVTADNSICFITDRGRFWVAPFVDNTWARAIKIPVEKGSLKGCHPGIAPDESFMVFYSIRPGALSGTETDLYLTLRRPDGTWTKPRNMGPRINSGYYEFGARISPDKKYMFFTRSNGWGGYSYCDTSDIYWVELKEYLPESHR